MPSFTFRRQFTIDWAYCDPAGIVFNPRFFEFFDTSAWMMFDAALGVAPHNLGAHFGIVGIALVDARANFLKPAKFGDVVEITSRITAFRRTSFDIEHRLTNGGELATEGWESRVWIGRDPADPDKIVALPIPKEVIEKFG